MSRPKGDSQPQAARRAQRSGGKTGSGFEQSYNAQPAVQIDSRLIVGQRVSDAPNDKEQLVPALAAIPGELGKPDTALTDSGFYSEAAVAAVEAPGPMAKRRLKSPPPSFGKAITGPWRTWKSRTIRRFPDRRPPPANT